MSQERAPADTAQPDTTIGSIVRRLGRPVWNLAREVRHLPDRLLHSRRRARARRRIAASAPFGSALFICHGNVCRSPYAALTFDLLTKNAGVPVDVASAGFVGPGRQPPAAALAAAARRKVDMTAHRSRLISAEHVARSDLIVVMSVEQAAALRERFGAERDALLILGDLDPAPITRRTLRDPWGSADAVFDESYERIDRCIRELVRLRAESAGRVDQR